MWDVRKDAVNPRAKEQRKALDDAVASGRYRIGVLILDVGRRYTEFDVTGIAEPVEWVASHCGVKPR